MNIICRKWVYKTKLKANGIWKLLKVGLVAKGFNQIHGINLLETFSPVIKPAIIKIILSIALSHQWDIRQLDVKDAFLHGKLDKLIYMKQPQGFIDQNRPNYVSQLHKALYKLK